MPEYVCCSSGLSRAAVDCECMWRWFYAPSSPDVVSAISGRE